MGFAFAFAFAVVLVQGVVVGLDDSFVVGVIILVSDMMQVLRYTSIDKGRMN